MLATDLASPVVALTELFVDMPVFIERTILQLPKIIVNGGKRGFLVELDPKELVRVLAAVPVDVAIVG